MTGCGADGQRVLLEVCISSGTGSKTLLFKGGVGSVEAASMNSQTLLGITQWRLPVLGPPVAADAWEALENLESHTCSHGVLEAGRAHSAHAHVLW